jgi:hypothetical protein
MATLPQADAVMPMMSIKARLSFLGRLRRVTISMNTSASLSNVSFGLHNGITNGLLLGKRATAAESMLKCWAVSARGVWASQSESDTSEKYELLNTSRNTRSVFPVFRT